MSMGRFLWQQVKSEYLIDDEIDGNSNNQGASGEPATAISLSNCPLLLAMLELFEILRYSLELSSSVSFLLSIRNPVSSLNGLPSQETDKPTNKNLASKFNNVDKFNDSCNANNRRAKLKSKLQLSNTAVLEDNHSNTNNTMWMKTWLSALEDVCDFLHIFMYLYHGLSSAQKSFFCIVPESTKIVHLIQSKVSSPLISLVHILTEIQTLFLHSPNHVSLLVAAESLTLSLFQPQPANQRFSNILGLVMHGSITLVHKTELLQNINRLLKRDR